MEQMIPLTIDGVHVEVPAGTTVLEAARIAKVNIPTLCYLKDINETANCRLCVVDCGGRALQAACVLPVTSASTTSRSRSVSASAPGWLSIGDAGFGASAGNTQTTSTIPQSTHAT